MLRIVALGAVLALIAACAATPKGANEADLAAGLASQERYGDAIAAIDQAILKEPRNAQYQAIRDRYLTDYASYINRNVSSLLSGDMTQAAIDEALTLISGGAKAGVPEQALASAKNAAEVARAQLYEDLEQLYASGVAAMDQRDWVTAYRALTRVNASFNNYEDVTPRLARVRQQAGKDYLGDAGRALKEDDLASARNSLNKLLQIDPQNPIARNLLKQVEARDNKEYFIGKLAAARESNDLDAIGKYCTAILSYDPDDATCQELLVEVNRAVGRRLVDEATVALAGGRLFDAAEAYMALHQFEDSRIASSRAAIQSSLATRLDRAAERAVDARQHGTAWILYEKLYEVDPTFEGLEEARRSVADVIRSRTRKQIAVFDFKSPSDSADAGVIVANNLISRLFNNAGRDISILERENLKSILEEMKLGQIGVVSEETAKEMGRIYGIDYAIMGSVLLYTVDTSESSSSKTVRYQIGEQIEDNIDYLNWAAANPNARPKERAEAPPAKIKVPKYAITEYDVKEIKKVGFIGLSFRIVDVATGENTRVDTLERKREVRDIGNEGLADAGVPYNPMEVPTDTEILQDLTDEVVDIMSVDVLRPLQSLEKTYFEQGEEYEKRNEPLKAVERYVDGIFNEQLKSVSASPLTKESTERIKRIMHEQSFGV